MEIFHHSFWVRIACLSSGLWARRVGVGRVCKKVCIEQLCTRPHTACSMLHESCDTLRRLIFEFEAKFTGPARTVILYNPICLLRSVCLRSALCTHMISIHFLPSTVERTSCEMCSNFPWHSMFEKCFATVRIISLAIKMCKITHVAYVNG